MHIYGRSRRIFLCAEQHSFIKPAAEADGGEIFSRESAEIHLGVLCIPDLDAIYEYSGVLAAHTPDIDRLESSDSAIVLQLYATEDTYRIGHILCGFQPFPGYAVRWGSPLCPVRQHCRDRQTVGSGRCPGGKGQRCGCQHA